MFAFYIIRGKKEFAFYIFSINFALAGILYALNSGYKYGLMLTHLFTSHKAVSFTFTLVKLSIPS